MLDIFLKNIYILENDLVEQIKQENFPSQFDEYAKMYKKYNANSICQSLDEIG